MRETVSYKKGIRGQSWGEYIIIGNTPKMQEVYRSIIRMAGVNTAVLIRGERGTGKRLISRAIYYNSSRRDRPFFIIGNIGKSEMQLESELFGHEKGVFPGAIDKRIGKFLQCDEGTVFLDEIGNIPVATQIKLLRILQEHTFEPLGSREVIKVDVRLIASTNKNLEGCNER